MARAGSSPAIGSSDNAILLGVLLGIHDLWIANSRARKRTKTPFIRQVFVKCTGLFSLPVCAFFIDQRTGYSLEKSNSEKNSAIGASWSRGCPFFRQVTLNHWL